MPSYAYLTLGQMTAQLNRLLGCGTAFTFWTEDELKSYIQEAIRWWGGMAMYFRQTGKVDLTPGQKIYDLTTDLEDVTGTIDLQGMTVTDRDIISDIVYNLMETPITNWAATWPGTEMFSFEEITNAVNNGRDEVLKMSGVLMTDVPTSVTVGQNRQDFSERIFHVVRASAGRPLWVIDNTLAQSTVSFGAPGQPKAYALNYTPQLSLDLFPAPENPVSLDIQCVRAGTPLTPQAGDTVLGIPDDWCWAVKYRALEDLYAGDGLARAGRMSEYAHMRVEDALEGMAAYQGMIWSELGGRRMNISSLAQLDLQRPGWESSADTPRSLHLLNWNLFAVYPVPTVEATITVEAVIKAPIPVGDADFIQVGPENIQAIYDYAQHLAMVKCQGAEFEQSIALYVSAKEAAMEYRATQAAYGTNYDLQLAMSNMDKWSRAYRRRSQSDPQNALQKGVIDG